MRAHRLIVFLALVLLVAGCAAQGPDTGQSSAHGVHGQPSAGDRAVLYDSLGSYSYRITTTSADAQRGFDQGLRLVYAFNHHEARWALREAARLDPACAMCFWGIALTEGSNYNDPTNTEREKKAATAAQEAARLAAGAPPPERALIQALAKRHSADPAAKRQTLDRDYADAMREVARQFPDDLEAATFFADSMMNLRPWSLWAPDGAPQPGTEEIVLTLERVIARNPNHPGALHLYIHAVEASKEPGRAEAAADRLRPLMPGAGHLVHMPSHIYWRVGDYAAAARANDTAAAVDHAYITKFKVQGVYPLMYYSHNLHFLAAAHAMQGRYTDAKKAADRLAAHVGPHVGAMPMLELFLPTPILVQVRFQRWD